MNPTPTVRIAVATKDGSKIDEHFGQAQTLDVYDLSAGGSALLERRVVGSYCQGGAGDEDQRELILRAMADCRAVFASRIGDGPRKRLAQLGIEPVDRFAHEPVGPSLQAWWVDSTVGASSTS